MTLFARIRLSPSFCTCLTPGRTDADANAVSNAARSLQELWTANGISTKQVKTGAAIAAKTNSITLRINKNLPVKDEGYTLQVSANAATIIAKDAAGL